MARKKKVNTDVSAIEITDEMLSLLNEIASDTKAHGFGYYSQSDISNLVSNDLAEINFNMPNINDPSQFATRITQKGIDLINSKGNNKVMAKKNVAPTVETVGGFEVAAFNPNAVKAKAPGAKRGRESKYHLDRLNPGEFVFVPCTPAHDTSEAIAKSLAGTVQAANKRFSEPTGEFKVVLRKARGSDEKIERQIEVTRPTRKYSVYAYTHNGVDGAAMVREM